MFYSRSAQGFRVARLRFVGAVSSLVAAPATVAKAFVFGSTGLASALLPPSALPFDAEVFLRASGGVLLEKPELVPSVPALAE
eukprot:CAMPEP_0206468950 /NCGR_PEP_ID=MMETSP0324_2-20121206/29964_1 /ASSEMBLY_ACC=CAM_ASM_000836 /TAXON_ID=2866 /ORGANISM="Crypthecodinium cohnii, Strain Seligo" /LENGTH=82 /DNA_ID=CAMNT_0053942565 /DNA_START=48 /DNA_END=296 /DNA_ORIENTATION=+